MSPTTNWRTAGISEMNLTVKEKRAFRWAPLSSSLVWGSCNFVGIWEPGWRTPYPWALIIVMTAFTYILYLPSSFVLKRLYVHWRNQNMDLSLWLFVTGLCFGTAWGFLTSPIGPAYKFVGPACGAMVGLTLAVALRKS